MHSKTILSSAAFALCAAIVNSQDNPVDVEASDIEAVVPAEIISPAQASSLANVADSVIASITTAPEFSSVVSVLMTAIPVTAQLDIGSDPEGYVMDILQGSPPPAWATALPPSVEEYFQSLALQGAQVAQSLASDFPELVTLDPAPASTLETVTSTGGGYAAPTGGYVTSNTTSPQPTGSAAAPGSPSSPEPFVPGSGASINLGGTAFAVMAASFGVGALLFL
ncbi:MAG: hypothetical protein Q9169_007714 [Polycauliona sp. 2 TL-2023]